MNRRRALVVSAIAAAVVALGLPAWAFFTSTTTTVSPTVSATFIGAPGTVTVTSIGGTATLNWSAPSAPSGAAFTYTVSRSGGTGSIAGGCAAASLSGTTCQDSAATAGQSYTWTVTPHIASWTGNTTSQVTATAAGALSKFAVSAPATATAGSAVNVTVTAQDSLGDTVTGYTGTPVLTSSDAQAVLPNGYPYTTSDAGQHQYSVTLKTAGSQTITATDGTPTGTSSGTTVSPAAANSITASSGSGQSAAVNTAFANPLVAIVKDAYGNPVPGVTVTFTAPSTGASATFKASSGACNNTGTAGNSCTSTTDANGLATSSAVTANSSTGAYSITAGAAGLTAANFSLANNSATPTVGSITPTSLTHRNSGKTITITGTNFVNGSTTVSFSGGATGHTRTDYVSWTGQTTTSTTITLTGVSVSNSVNSVGSYTVTVTTPNGSATISFTVN